MTMSLRVLSPSLAKPFVPFTRPSSQDQDQDQCYKTKTKTTARKTKTKTEFDWSETGLATKPKSRTTSLFMSRGVMSIPCYVNDASTSSLAGWLPVRSRGQAGSAVASVRSRYLDRETCWPGCQCTSPGSVDHPRRRSTQTSRCRPSLVSHRGPCPDDTPAAPTQTPDPTRRCRRRS